MNPHIKLHIHLILTWLHTDSSVGVTAWSVCPCKPITIHQSHTGALSAVYTVSVGFSAGPVCVGKARVIRPPHVVGALPRVTPPQPHILCNPLTVM